MDAVRAAIDLIKSGHHSDQAEGAVLAADIFQAMHGSPWLGDHKYQFEPGSIDEGCVESLESALLQGARSDLSADIAGSMVWALGKRVSPALRSFFLEVLAKTVDEGSAALYQTIIALDNLDEPSLQNVGSFSVHDHEQNRQLARCVLEAVSRGREDGSNHHPAVHHTG